MKRINLPMIFDALFYGFCAFVLSVSVLRYESVPLLLSVGSGAAIGLVVCTLSLLLMYTKKRKKLLSKKERERRDALLLHLALEKPERVRAELLDAYLADGKEANCFQDELCVEGKPFVPVFSLEPLSADEAAHLIRRFGAQKFTIACKSASAEAEKLLNSFGIRKIDGDEIYALFERTKKFPDPLICGELPRKSAKTKLKNAFSRSNARPFFLCGALLLFMSLFTLFPVYYLVSGSVLLFCAIVIRLLGFAT